MNAKIGAFLYWLHRIGLFHAPTWSHNIADIPNCGYGELDNNGFWQFPVNIKKRRTK